MVCVNLTRRRTRRGFDCEEVLLVYIINCVVGVKCVDCALLFRFTILWCARI
jgi:hypothetical protein